MHFFEKQKVDQVGIISVALQKVVIFLMLVNVFSLFSDGGFFGIALCIMGLIGAVRRRPALLMVYFVGSMFLIFSQMLGLFAAFYFALGMDDADYYGSSSASSSSSSIGNNFSTVPTSLAKNVMRRVFPDSSSNSTSSSAAASESMGSGSYASWENYSDSSTYLLTFLALLLVFFLLYMKIFSMVLALRLRKMINAVPVLPTEYRVPSEENVDNSCAVEYSDAVEMQNSGAPISMPAPFFNQPGYMPFTPIPMPNNMQYPGNPSMVPPPMMYGQYPVYYSFAPIPPHQQQQPAAPEDSKL